jgi:SAM-dependent methyltransferase
VDLRKAGRRLEHLCRQWKGKARIDGARVLDVGCGLGFYSEAFRLLGGTVVGIDSSAKAIEVATSLFPEVQFRACGFPDALSELGTFDLIWASDFSLLNTFDVDFIDRAFVQPCTQVLNPRGMLIIGWRSSFDGRPLKTGHREDSWAHWDLATIRRLHEKCQLQGPRIVGISPYLSNLFFRLSWFYPYLPLIGRRPMPFYSIRRIERIPR